MDLRVYTDPAALARAAAADVAALAREAISARGRFSIALAGGSTPAGTYAALAAEHRDSVDWARTEFFWGDERAVRPDHPESNYARASRTLLAPLAVPAARIHRMQADATDLEDAARAYERELAAVLGHPAVLDLVLLGMGADGHTLSVFPGAPAPDPGRSVVVATHPQTGAARLTLTLGTVQDARAVRILVSGAEKCETLRAVLFGARDGRFPAQRVADAPNAAWLFDVPAAVGRAG